MSSDLVAFLNARYDEEEHGALAALAANPGPWQVAVDGGAALDSAGRPIATLPLGDRRFRATIRHIVGVDPARALREIGAKRRLLQAHMDNPGTISRCRACGATDGPCETKRLLALPYVFEPGYDPTWRP